MLCLVSHPSQHHPILQSPQPAPPHPPSTPASTIPILIRINKSLALGSVAMYSARRQRSDVDGADARSATVRRRLNCGCQPVAGCQPERRPLKVGTDCSGLDVPVAMLEEILRGRNRSIHHVFSSENDPKTLRILLHNFAPTYHYTDLEQRADRRSSPGAKGKWFPAADELPELDIYAAGFPCQP